MKHFTLLVVTAAIAVTASAQVPVRMDKSPVLAVRGKALTKKENFILVNPGAQTFTPRTISEIVPGAKAEDASKTVKLPNGKTTTLGKHLEEVNAHERRLAALGVKQVAVPRSVLLSKAVPASNNRRPAATSSANTNAVPATVLTSRFGTLNAQAFKNVKPIVSEAITAFRRGEIEAMPAMLIDRKEELEERDFKVADYGVTISAKQYQKARIKPFFLENSKRNSAGLKAGAEATENFMTMGFEAILKVDVPGLGKVDAYKLSGDFTSKSNAQQKHHVKTKLTVLGTVLVNDDNDLSGDDVSYTKNRTYNTAKLLGAADFFTYALNAVIPVDIYLNATSVGAEFDVDMSRTGVNGSIKPLVAQSIIMETSIMETGGIATDMIGNSIDAGVGGELRLIEGGISFNSNMGLAMNGNNLVLIDDVYQGFDLKLLKGRLYTFTQYPWFKCSSILRLGDAACWEMVRQENDIFESGSALNFRHTLADDDRTKALNW